MKSVWRGLLISHLEPVISPAGEFHGAPLLVEREIFDVDGAR